MASNLCKVNLCDMPCGDYDDVFCNFHDKWCFICRQYSASRELISRGRLFGYKQVMLCSPCRDVVFSRLVLCARNINESIRHVERCFDNENEASRALEIVLEPPRISPQEKALKQALIDMIVREQDLIGPVVRGGKPPDKCDILLS
jgi:hypothetical protein